MAAAAPDARRTESRQAPRGRRQRLRVDLACSDLRGRLSLFGATRLTTEQRAIIGALSEHREVHLWLPNPSLAMWRRLQQTDFRRRRSDPPRNP